jgi:hypothetical protein
MLADELAFLVGPAAGEEQIHATAWGPSAQAYVTSQGDVALDGALIIQTLHEQRTDGSIFDLVNVFMRDPANPAELLLYAFDSLGYTPEPPSRGTWDGQTLTLTRTSPRGSSRTTFRPTAGGFAWAKEYQAPGDNRWQPVVTGTLHPQ